MSFLFFVAIVIMAVYLRKQHNQINELKNRMQDLDYKLYYNYHLIRNMPNHNVSKQNVSQRNQDYRDEQYSERPNTAPPRAAERPAQQQVPLSVRLSSIESVTKPTQSNVGRTEIQDNTVSDRPLNPALQTNASAAHPINPPLQTNTSVVRPINPPLQTNTSAVHHNNPTLQTDTSANYKKITYGQAVHQHNSVNPHMRSGIPDKPTDNQSVTQSFGKLNNQAVGQNQESPKTNKKSIESWLGSHVFNLIASLLIFIGLICLGTLVYEYITDTVKIIAMYLISGGIVALGTVLTKKHRNYFSLGLAGCGCGALFISVLLTHIYFNAISDVTAFSLLVVWTGFTLFISKKVDSVLLSVTAHAGMAISVCFAFSLGFSQTRIILPVIYQIVSIAVIIAGNIFCCKKTYRFGLLMSMTLLVYSSIVMNITLSTSTEVLCGLSAGATALLFAVQTAGISFISYLLSVSTTKLYEDKEKLYSVKIPITIHIVNKIIWSVGIFVSVGQVLYTVLSSAYGIDNYVYPLTAVCVVTLLHLAVTLFVSEKLNFNERLSNISIWSNSLIISLSLIMQCIFRNSLHGVPFIFVYAALIILIVKYTKNIKLNLLISSLLSADALFMTIYGYRSLANANLTVFSILYLTVMCAMVYLYWLSQSKESREKHLELLKTVEYLWVSISSVVIVSYAFDELKVPVLLIILSSINILSYIFKYGGKNNNILRYIMKTETVLVLYASFAEMTNTVSSSSESFVSLLIIRLVLIVMTGILFTCIAVDAVKSKTVWQAVFTGVTFSFFVTGFCIGFAEILYPAYVYSNILHCREFFLVLSAALLIMYKIIKNSDISLYSSVSLGIDAILMLLLGYHDLAQAGLSAVSVIYLILTCIILFTLWHSQKEEIKQKMLLPFKTVEYLWVSISLIAIITCSLNEFALSASLIALAAINILAYIFKYSREENNFLDVIVKIESYLVLYTGFIEIAGTVPTNKENSILLFAVRIVLILLCIVLFACTSVRSVKSQSTFRQLFTSLTFTCFVTAFCLGFSNILSPAYVYANILVCKPFFFVFAASSLAIFVLSKNKNLNLFILSSMAVDALSMILFGYTDLIRAKRAVLDTFGLESIYKTVNLNLTFICIIHLAVICAMLFCLWYFQTEEIKKKMLLPLKTAQYCWVVFSLTEILLFSVKSMRTPFTLIVLCSINIIAYVLKYGGKEKNYLNTIIQITSFVVLYLAFIDIAFKIAPNSENLILRYTLKAVLIMMCAALYICAGADLAKSKDVGQQIFMGLTFTIFVNTVCCGLSSILSLTYIFSIICMVTALFCVIAGFILQAKGLRLYGLLVIILCVLKLVTIDISSANSISRVIAFIAGGIICFAISGIYNRFERLYGFKSETTENTK